MGLSLWVVFFILYPVYHSQMFFSSIRFCSGTSGRHSHRRVGFYYFQSGGCSNVGTWQVFISSMIAKCYWQPSQTSRKSNIISLLNGARVGKSTKVLQRRINFENVRELFYHEFETKIGSHEGTWQHILCTVFGLLALCYKCYKQLTLDYM